MSANVESLFSVREKPWHGLGTIVKEAPTSAEAIKLAGLDWNVVQRPLKTVDGMSVPNFYANVRDRDNSVLGVVGDRYQIVQNAEAFDFTDSLLDEGVRYETAGSLKGGRTIWLLAKMPDTKILGDDFEPYVCFTNSHDGTGAIKVCCTPIRVVCNNTLNLALNTAKRSWSTRHTGDIRAKLDEARYTLDLASKYIDKLAVRADQYANSSVTEEQIRDFLDELFPLKDDATERQKRTVETAKEEIMVCYLSPDIAKFLGTKYGLINAVSDWCGHAEPKRKTADYQSNNWGRIIDGHPVLDRAVELLGVH